MFYGQELIFNIFSELVMDDEDHPNEDDLIEDESGNAIN